MSQLKSMNGSRDPAADELSNAVRQADISESIIVPDETPPDLCYDEVEQKRQQTWRAHVRRRRDFQRRRALHKSDNAAATSSSSVQTLAESMRQTVVVALLAHEGDPRTKIGHWRVKDVGGVKQACFKHQVASELCYNIALGVHYLLQKDPPEHEPDPFSYAIDIPSLGDKDSGIQPTHVPDFSFKIYKPQVFRRLRAQFGISETDFRNSLEATEQVQMSCVVGTCSVVLAWLAHVRPRAFAAALCRLGTRVPAARCCSKLQMTCTSSRPWRKTSTLLS